MGGAGGPPPGAMSAGSASGGSGMMGGPGGKAGEGASTPAWANRLFEERSWNFGTVRRGEGVMHLFQLINTLDQPVHVASVRTSASFVKAFPMVTLAQMGGAQSRQTQAWIGPYQSVAIEVEMDTRRFTGDKIATVYVQFDQPALAEVRLQVHARSLEPPAGINDKAEPKARILELEVKVDQLLKEIGALRDELKQRPGKPPGGGAGPTPGPEAGDSTKP